MEIISQISPPPDTFGSRGATAAPWSTTATTVPGGRRHCRSRHNGQRADSTLWARFSDTRGGWGSGVRSGAGPRITRIGSGAERIEQRDIAKEDLAHYRAEFAKEGRGEGEVSYCDIGYETKRERGKKENSHNLCVRGSLPSIYVFVNCSCLTAFIIVFIVAESDTM